MMAGEQKLRYLLIILILIHAVASFDPLSFLSASVAVVGTTLHAGWHMLHCRHSECCDNAWIPHNFTMLEASLKEDLFGQHIAKNVILSALKAHFREDASPKKALVLSLHGFTGTGKTFVSQFIINSMFKLGLQSKFVHLFAGRTHFPMESKADIYKLHLIDWIRGNVSQCGRTLFVFDEVEKMPKGMLDAIKPFLDYHEEIDGIDFRNTIFIFLSNTGGSLIAERLLQLWENGRRREDIQLEDFEDLIRKGAFNENGGFHRSEAIESNLIDHYIPFLPMEEFHVRKCIVAEFHRRGEKAPREEHIKEVLKWLTFGPEPHKLFSNSGCKRIIPKVGSVMEQILFDM